MLPAAAALAPIDPNKTRALTTIYAPRKPKPRKHKTAQSRMLDELPIKQTLSPFHPLPAIGQKVEVKPKTKVIVLEINKNDPGGDREVKLQQVLKPLTPLRIHTYRKNSFDPIDKKPQQLLRENTYDVLEPLYVKKRDPSITRKVFDPQKTSGNVTEPPKVSPKTRFKKAALKVAKLSSMPETGKLLCLREREETFNIRRCEDDKVCKLQRLPQSPTQKLNKLSEIFDGLDMQGRHRDKMKKENSWF